VSESVLDSSAVLAYLNQEPGAEIVHAAIAADAAVVTVNFCEVLTRLLEAGRTMGEIDAELQFLPLTMTVFDEDLARRAAALRGATRHRGLSLGDRACLALAARLGVPAITADRAWSGLGVGVEIRLIR
jgi:ribonuclease VapC